VVFGQRTFLTKRPSLHVILRPIRGDMWVEGQKILRAPPGATFLFPLSRNPVPEFHTSFDILRFYISRASLDELSFDRGLRRTAGLNDCLGLQDPVMHGLATALLDPVEQANERSALFVDHIALAFHAHVTDVYGKSAARAHPVSGGLSPWQRRHALDFMVARLGDDPTIAQLGYRAHVLRTDRTPLLALRSVSFCRMGLARWSASGGQNTNIWNA
jgi:AraC family transcriptional regulator